MLSSNKPHCHARLPKPSLKILLICWNIFEKQLSQATSYSNQGHQIDNFLKQHRALTRVVRLLHRSNFQIFSTKSNMIIKVARYLPKSEATVYRKPLIYEYLLNKVAGLQPKKKTPAEMFSHQFTQYFRKTFLRNAFGWWLPLLNAFSLLRRPHQQNVILDLGCVLIIFKYFQSKHYESLVSSCFWKS